jgi:hypothetical protein
MTNGNVAFGTQVHERTIKEDFLSGPGEDLVPKTLMQLASVPAFTTLFGPYKPRLKGQNVQTSQQRWADYNRFDWSLRQLPAINVYEAETEDKDSDQAFLRGTINLQVFWQPNLRRSDWSRVPVAFKGAMENFFASDYVKKMLDELYWIERPMKVWGLNEYGKVMTWSPNLEGVVESEMVPVTLISVRYRIDLRAWYRALVFMDRTKGDPFERTLSQLSVIGGEGSAYNGVTDTLGQDVMDKLQDEIPVSNPPPEREN